MNFSPEIGTEENFSEINVIPLIDVLLVLLIFFMASASFVATGGVDVRLPASRTRAESRGGSELTISLSADGEVRLNGIAVLDLPAELAKQREGGPVVVLRADERVEHGRVVAILDEIKRAGFAEIAIATVLK